MKRRRKIPTKTELQQLQKLYKTDERIGERLGGVPAYLVAYWRRKKNIPKYSLPKFSENEVRTLWERYGEDEKAGLELGISKAAFYNWRRRYGIKEKPAFLKLEQLELNFPGSKQPAHATSLYGQRTVIQKILARATETERVDIGQRIEIEPDLAIAPAMVSEVVEQFRIRGAEFVWNPGKLVLSLDMNPHREHADPAGVHKVVREFARRQNIKMFFDLRDGSCQQLVLERGLLRPGQVTITGTGQASSLGCLAALSMPVDALEMASVWINGRYTMTVPETVRITIGGRRYRGVYAVDVALSVAAQLGAGAVEDKVIEYTGSAISQMTIGERFTLSGLTLRTGARAVLCAYDATTRRYLTGRTMTRYQPVVPDKDAEYGALYQINIEHLTPQIALKSGDATQARPVSELEDTPVQQIILGSRTAGRFEDLRVAADILKGKQVHEDTRLVIIPGSRQVYLEALKKGLVRVFAEAGAIIMNAGDCSCTVGSELYLTEGERCLSTCGDIDTQSGASGREVYLCSPATAAASALRGAITDPTRYVR